jgi:hypothetical protein
MQGRRVRVVSTLGQALRHAGGHYATALRWGRHPVRSVEAEARHLHEIELRGESAETPFIAILGLLLFLGSIFLVLLAIAVGAYYLAS